VEKCQFCTAELVIDGKQAHFEYCPWMVVRKYTLKHTHEGVVYLTKNSPSTVVANKIPVTTFCKEEGCGRVVSTEVYCKMHLKRLERTGSLEKLNPNKYIPKAKTVFKTKQCRAAGCEEDSLHFGLCENHMEEFNLA
jgi:hypothetical protein